MGLRELLEGVGLTARRVPLWACIAVLLPLLLVALVAGNALERLVQWLLLIDQRLADEWDRLS